jgi:arylformamidase
MIVHIPFNTKTYRADLLSPLDLSLPLQEGSGNPTCYWADAVKFETIRMGDFVGSVKEGGSVNYQKLLVTPHGNGTHTECYGHISADGATLNQHLKVFHFIAELISVIPERVGDDFLITRDAVAEKIKNPGIQALVIRTLPNTETKKTAQYSGTNPPYLHAEAAAFIAACGIQHLLLDLPSVDREVDGGQLRAHKAFWQFPENIQKSSTITELIFAEDTIADGLYLLNLQITSLEMDASPSKPVLYKLTEVL